MNRSARCRAIPASRGYVLLVTLGLLVLSAALLVAVARSAVARGTVARLEEQRLQRRWAIESARRAVLPFAEQILVTAEARENRPVPRLTAKVRLGGLRVSLQVADEQAKANVNELLSRDTPASVEDRLRRALSGGLAYAHVRLRPAPSALTRPGPGVDPFTALPPVSGFGQVFDDTSPGVLRAVAGPGPLEMLTVWGDGGLNILRADAGAMRVALTPGLTTLQIDRLLQARAAVTAVPRDAHAPASLIDRPGGPPPARPTDAVGLLLQRAGVAPAERGRLPLVARSACHSLLVGVRSDRGVWYDTSVLDRTDPDRPRAFGVAW